MSYQEYISSVNNKIEYATEYTLRTQLENLLNFIKQRKSISIIQENKKTPLQNFGKPDFRVSENDLEIGWIETKPINDDLSIYVETPQLKRYLNVIPNLLFTNYRDFILFRDGEILLSSTLFNLGDNELDKSNIEKTEILINEFFNSSLQQIERTEKLSVLLAKHAQYFHDELLEMWYGNDQSQFKEKLKGLFDLFKETLIEDLTPEDFIDAYAQTVSYGLLLSALSSDKEITKYNFIEFIPKSLSIFEEIFSLLRLSNIPEGISWIIDKLFIILNNTDYFQVQKELSFANKKGPEYEDPYIYFYENFLTAYNPEIRLERGVFYTPASVVHFIVKVVNLSLKEDFKKSGIDDDEISLLDFATGTGTFLLESFKVALENIDKGQINGFIRNHLLKNFYGFEYLIAPYTIAHLKLTKFLAEAGFNFEQENDRTRIYLTNTLDDSHFQRNPLFPYISDEGEQATAVKMTKKIWVVLGNPPYSNYSKNKSAFIQNLVADYKKGLQESKINLDDDYIKFIRFAQAKIEGAKYTYLKGDNPVTGKIESANQGIIGIITNNSYLYGVTHRQMRKSLLETFDKIYIINLHGNSIIGEQDKNVFDIMIGVSIAIFIKTTKPLKKKEVYYYSTLENGILTRTGKDEYLYNHDLKTVEWTRLNPVEPYYWFVSKDFTHQEQYDKGWKITDIFDEYSSGIQTKRDKITIHLKKESLQIVLIDLLKLDDRDFRKKYKLPKDGRDWKISLAREKTNSINDEFISKIHYRPFDYRFTYITDKSKAFVAYPRYKIMQNFLNKYNLGLIFPRFAKGQKSNYGFISNQIIDIAVGGRHTGSETYIAPLYVYNSNGNSDENGNGFLFKDEEKKDNFTREFRKFLKNSYLKNHTPEQILGYIYAILFSNTYREKYFEFLKIDFPKIPFTDDKKLFNKLSKLGTELIENHLLNRTFDRNEMPVFAVEGNNKVSDIKFEEKTKRLYINKTQYFDNFTKEVWEFEIGGYQVFDKYLKSRKDLELSYEEINHIKKVSAAISKTIELQKNIDKLCYNWV